MGIHHIVTLPRKPLSLMKPLIFLQESELTVLFIYRMSMLITVVSKIGLTTSNYLGWRRAIDTRRLNTPELFLRAAIGLFPHTSMIYFLNGSAREFSIITSAADQIH
jgi:hypothetical protein